jgi:hypothetical protein
MRYSTLMAAIALGGLVPIGPVTVETPKAVLDPPTPKREYQKQWPVGGGAKERARRLAKRG